MLVSNRIRKLVGFSALAAFGAAEIALVCAVIGYAVEFVFDVDLPLINWVVRDDAPSDASSAGNFLVG